MAEGTFDLGGLCSSALTRSMRGEFDPAAFLDELSASVQVVLPHDRLMVACVEGDGRTVSVFAEHAVRGFRRHAGGDTLAVDPGSRLAPDAVLPAAIFEDHALCVRARRSPGAGRT